MVRVGLRVCVRIVVCVCVVGLCAGGRATAGEDPRLAWGYLERLSADETEAITAFVRVAVGESSGLAADLRLRLSSVPWALRPVWREAVTPLLLGMLQSADDQVRARAVLTLMEVYAGNPHPPAAVLDAVLAALQDKDGPVRYTAAWSLERLPTEQIRAALPRIRASLASMRNPDRVGVLNALAVHGISMDTPVLLERLSAGSSEAERIAAAGALGLLGPGTGTEVHVALVKALRGDPEWGVRRSAAKALARRGQPEDLAVLWQAGKRKEDAALRWIVLEDLGQAGPETVLEIDRVLARVRDRDPVVRASAVRLLAARRVTAPRAVAAIRGRLLDRERDVRRAARTAYFTLVRDGLRPDEAEVLRLLRSRSESARLLGLDLAARRVPPSTALQAGVAKALQHLPEAWRTDELVLALAVRWGADAAGLRRPLKAIDRTHGFILTAPPPEEAAIAWYAVLPAGPQRVWAIKRIVKAFREDGWSRSALAPRLLALLPTERIRRFQPGVLADMGPRGWPQGGERWALVALGLPDAAARAQARGLLLDMRDTPDASYVLSALDDMPGRVPLALDLLLPWVGHPDPDTRRMLATLLRRVAPRTPAIEAALATLRTDRLPVVRLEATDRPGWN